MSTDPKPLPKFFRENTMTTWVINTNSNTCHIYDYQRNHQLGSKIDKETKAFPEEYNQLLRMLDRLRLEEIANVNYHFCRQYEPLMKGFAEFEEEMNKAKQLNNN